MCFEEAFYMADVKIKDIYAGKPDAKDEIEAEGMEPFIKSFILPPNFNVKALLHGTYYFITGYKGIGKTALLYYLDNCAKGEDSNTWSSFIFFKGDYSDTKRQELEHLSKRLLSSVSIGNDVVLDGDDFEYIWRWLFYQRIIADNGSCNERLFVDNSDWKKFKECIEKISVKSRNRLFIPPKIKFSLSGVDVPTQTELSQDFELDFSKPNCSDTDAYRAFTSAIDQADMLLEKVERTDIPYYIFVDELEAYYGDQKIFYRDLRLIRDLIFTVKKLNSAFSSYAGFGETKIICSVRTEILNSINRFIVTKELNKVTSGFEVPVVWDYNNTNSFAHPVLKILTKRIAMAEEEYGVRHSEKELIDQWFPETIRGVEPANYILNNSWNKPRDIVRFILSAQGCLSGDDDAFTQSSCEKFWKKYSVESLNEIKEEMRALYSSEQIDEIISCLMGFRAVFTFDELYSRTNNLFKNTVWTDNELPILRDLYRLGFIGNYSPTPKLYRWQHHGDEGFIISDDWKIMIHKALQSALSVSNRHDAGIQRIQTTSPFQKNAKFEVERVSKDRILLGRIYYDQCVSNACMKLSQQPVHFVQKYGRANQLLVGMIFDVLVGPYDEVHHRWIVSVSE